MSVIRQAASIFKTPGGEETDDFFPVFTNVEILAKPNPWNFAVSSDDWLDVKEIADDPLEGGDAACCRSCHEPPKSFRGTVPRGGAPDG